MGGEQLVPYLKYVDETVEPLGLTVPAKVAALVVTPVAGPVTVVGASSVVNVWSPLHGVPPDGSDSLTAQSL